jgi:hypothetical protein
MTSWLNYAALMARAKTGANTAAAIWSVIAAIAILAGAVCLSVAAYVFIADRYDSLTAALALAGFYSVLALVAVLCAVMIRRRTMNRAHRELAARPTPWLDPRLLAIGIKIGTSLGWKKSVPIALVGVFAAGIAREWSGHQAPADKL